MSGVNRLMATLTVSPTAKHTATVIFLHGLGDTGHGWLEALKEKKLPHVKYMCPNATPAPVTLNFGMRMPSWFDIKSLSFLGDEDEAGINASTQMVMKLIEEEMKSGISSERIVVGGFSQGGSVALNTLQTSEHKLGGCIGMSTFLSLHGKFAKITKKVNQETPVFLGHGNDDPVVSYEFGCKTYTIMKEFYKNCKFNTYDNLGHGSAPDEMADVEEFIAKTLPKI